MNRPPAVHRDPTALLEMIVSGDDGEMLEPSDEGELRVEFADESVELATLLYHDEDDEDDEDPYCELGDGD